MWSRLSLRWQVAFAVLVPSLAIALFSGLYLPARQEAHALELLTAHALSVSRLAAHESASLGEGRSPDTLASLSALFARVGEGGGINYQGVLAADGSVVHALGTPPSPVKGQGAPAEGCKAERGESAVNVRCALGAGRVYVASFSNQVVAQERLDYRWPWTLGHLVATLVGLGLAVLIGRAIVDPVSRVTDAARDVARGDVSRDALDVSAAGEVRLMAHSFNEMLMTLRGTVAEMVSRTEQLSAASRGLTGASADQEHVISQQAAYAQQIAATFEELSRTAEQISSSTEVVESSARRTHEAVAEAMAVVAQVVAGINDIRIESKGVADAIVGLNQDLQQVTKIAQVINQVSERSDLLALNAALEGTKAGEVGRGFSLVAAEMRKLAENVSASARDIARIVEKVQDSGEEAASKARVGMATSDRGVEVAEQASAVFQRIVELARGTSEAARQITIATRQQRQSSEQAVQGARNVAELVKQGVDATGRTTRIALDLQSVAEGLTVVTSKFKVQRPG
ncbi:methyl-accepting chemotaxis protein [Myxococcaceae bacterium GXIMD 01537]